VRKRALTFFYSVFDAKLFVIHFPKNRDEKAGRRNAKKKRAAQHEFSKIFLTTYTREEEAEKARSRKLPPTRREGKDAHARDVIKQNDERLLLLLSSVSFSSSSR